MPSSYEVKVMVYCWLDDANGQKVAGAIEKAIKKKALRYSVWVTPLKSKLNCGEFPSKLLYMMLSHLSNGALLMILNPIRGY
jgi:hypothetical protein